MGKLKTTAFVVYFIGVLFRAFYIFYFHPPTKYIYSDMERHIGTGRIIVTTGSHGIASAVHSPGGGYFYGLLYYFDPSLKLAMIVQFIISCLIPIVIFQFASKIFNPKVAAVSLMFSSAYFPFISYAGFFMTENVFTLALVCLVSFYFELVRTEDKKKLFLLSLFLGLSVALVSSIKSMLLIIFFLYGLYGIYLFFRNKERKFKLICLGFCIGLFSVLSLFSYRCTRLSEGKFCLISREVALSVLTGRVGDIKSFTFRDPIRNFTHTYGYPVACQRADYINNKQYLFGVYESDKLWDEFFSFFKEHPFLVVKYSLRMVYDLFWGNYPWPNSSISHAEVLKLFLFIYLIVMLIPSIVYTATNYKTNPFNFFILWAPLLGTIITALIASGEPRYRIPSDALIIILSSAFWVTFISRENENTVVNG